MRHTKSKKLQQWMVSFCIAMTLCMIGNIATFAAECVDIRQAVFRLHILANSDEYEDQALKLLVRDAILAETETLFSDQTDKQAVLEQTALVLDDIEQIANQTLQDNGSDLTATVSIQNVYFTTRYYENYTLPAGYYDALQVSIGKAEGQNWWCVLYPALCISSAVKESQIDAVFDADQQDMVEHGDDYQISFAVVEWIESVKNYIKR